MCFLGKTLFTRYLFIFCTLLWGIGAVGQQPEAPCKHSSHPKAPHYLPDPSQRSCGSAHTKFWGPKAWLNELEENSSHMNSAGGRALRLQAARWEHGSLLRAGKQGEVLQQSPTKSSAGTNFHVKKWTWLPVLAQDLIPASFQVIQHHPQSIHSQTGTPRGDQTPFLKC